MERARSESRNIKETRLAVSLQLLKLGDGYLGVHDVILSFLYGWDFLIIKKKKLRKEREKENAGSIRHYGNTWIIKKLISGVT